MAEKTLKTRILVKYDTFANWVEKNPILKAGELAVATIATGNTEEVNSVETPQVLIKVGDGINRYTALKMISGLSADVYSWAKAATKPSYTAEEIDGLSTYISGQIKDTDTLFKLVATDNTNHHYKLQSKAKGAEDWADIPESAIIDIPDNTGDINELKGLVGDVAVTTQIANAISALNLADTYATIAYVNDKIAEIPVQASYEIKKLTTATNGYLASYQLEKDGAKVGDVINIPKDYLVKSASCETCAEAGNPIEGLKVGDKYLDFVINVKSGSATDEHIYVNVADLVDTYTAGDNVSIKDNAISVDLSGKVDKVEGKVLIDENVADRLSYDSATTNIVVSSISHGIEARNFIGINAGISETGLISGQHLTIETDGVDNVPGVIGIEAKNGDVTANVCIDPDSGAYKLHKLSEKANTADLSSIATSGKVTDLVQAADDVLIFDCGNATI